MRRLAPLALLAALVASATAQTTNAPLTAAERAQGYALRGADLIFAFDEAAYGLDPERVVVTGAFRGWSDSMGDADWALAEVAPGIWTLTVPNADYGAVPPATPFKFRVDDGRWLDPPSAATNVEGGNLVFLYGASPPRLVAELRGDDAIWVEVTGDAPGGGALARPLDPGAYRVERWDGVFQPVVLAATPHEAHSALLRTTGLDPDHVHYVSVEVSAAGGGTQTLRAMARFDGLWRDAPAPGRRLGVRVQHDAGVPEGAAAAARPPSAQTLFELHAPRAKDVVVHLYADRTGAETERHRLREGEHGVWYVALDGDRSGTWYDFSVVGPEGPGSHFTNVSGARFRDPYATVADDWGRAMILDDRDAPVSRVRGGRPAFEDVVAYEVHVQDFTDTLPVDNAVRGTFDAFAMPGLTNRWGEPVGLDHIANLGINVVHLMPVQEYLHYPDSTWAAAFADDPFMQAQGVAEENYQWGYRITDFFAVETRYRSRAPGRDGPGQERQQLRDLVRAFHERGIAVIVDFVFNHTGENMEARQRLFTFNGIDKHYAYRLDEQGEHIGVFGNEVKSENRPFVQQWLLEQCKTFVDDFGVDGFRIDLAGQTDEQTLRWIRESLPADLIWYGEPWIASSDSDYEANPSWDWYKADAPIPFFQDDTRTALKGPTSPPDGTPASRGFAGGAGNRAEAMRAVANDYAEEPRTTAGIAYLDIHDNWALADRYASCTEGACAFDGRQGVDAPAMRIAAAMLLTTLGPVVINGGTEIARSKGAAPLPDAIGGQLVKETALSPVYLNGRGDTYNLRAANQYDWGALGNAAAPVDAVSMRDWWTALIGLRLGDAGAALRVADVPPDHVTFLTPDDARALGYRVGGRVLVLVNAGDADVAFGRISLPGGTWRRALASDRDGWRADDGASAVGFLASPTLGPQSVEVWVRP